MWRVGIDVGGTFTDLFAWQDGGTRQLNSKVLTTKHDRARSDVQRQTKIHTDGVHEVIGGLDGKGGWKSPLLASVPFHYGETFMFESTSGGGWGSALERSTATVLDDVLDEYIALNAARKHYGVVIDATSMTVDDAATKQLRAQMCSAACGGFCRCE